MAVDSFNVFDGKTMVQNRGPRPDCNGRLSPHAATDHEHSWSIYRSAGAAAMPDDVGATLLEKGAPFADSAGRFVATIHDWSARGGLRNPQRMQKGLTEGLGTAFP
jgi:hypothetical protein